MGLNWASSVNAVMSPSKRHNRRVTRNGTKPRPSAVLTAPDSEPVGSDRGLQRLPHLRHYTTDRDIVISEIDLDDPCNMRMREYADEGQYSPRLFDLQNKPIERHPPL